MNPKYTTMRWTVRLAPQLLMVVCFELLSVWAVAQTTASVSTDQTDYPPGSIVYITGSGFQVNETVILQVLHADGTSDNTTSPTGAHLPWNVVANSEGNFSATWVVPSDEDEVGASLRLTADGQSSGVHAEVIFTDAVQTQIINLTPSTGGCGQSITVSAVLQQKSGPSFIALAGQLVTFTLGTNTASAISNSSGVASTTILVPTVAANLQANFSGSGSGSSALSASSKSITFTVTNVITPTVSIDITAGSNATCAGSSVTFTATATNGGTPSYQWKKDGVNVGTDATYLDAGITGGNVTCVMTTSLGGCVTNTTATSNTINLSVRSTPTSTITITGSNPICPGGSTSFKVTGPNNGNVTYTDGTSNFSVGLNNGGNSTITVSPTVSTTYSLVSVAYGDAPTCAQSATGSVTVNISQPPGIITQPANVITTYGNGDVSFFVSATGTGLSYQWQVNSGSGYINTGSNSPTLNVANPTLAMNDYTYQVIVSGTCAPAVASNVVSLTVKNPCAFPTLSVVATDVTCAGANNGSVDLITSGGSPTPFTYLWSNGATTEDVSGLAPGNYSVTVTSASGGCTASISQTIGTMVDVTLPIISGVPANSIINSSDADPSTCTQIATWVTPTATDNCSLSSFTSDHASGDAFAVGTTTVTYTAVDASGNVQKASFTVTVNDNTKPAIAIAPITVNTNSGCTARGVSLGTPVTSDNCVVAMVANDAPSVFPLGSTVVTWTVTDSHGNSATTTQLVTVTDVEPPVFTSVSENIELSSCTPTATWSIPIATDNCSVVVTQTAGPSSGSIFANGSTTTITYVATDGSGNFSNTSFTITRLAALSATATGANVSCYGGNNGSASVSVSGGRSPYSYSWSNGGSTSSINGLVAGVYSVTVTDADGCSAYSSYSVTQPTALTSSATSTAILCNGGSATVMISANGGTAPYSGTGSFSRAAGSWSFTVTDANGCTSTSSVTITEPSPLTATITTNNSYLYFGYSGDQSATITAKPSGGTAPYTVAITMVNGDGSRIRTAGKLICDYINNSGDEVWTAGSNTLSTVSGCGVEPTSTSKNNITTGGSYSVNVTLLDDARFIATVTDANGCTYTTPYTNAARVDAEDVRCFAGNTSVQKVTMCHRTGNAKNPCVTICIDESAVNDHLAHGDFFGPCNNACTAPVANARVTNDNGVTNAQPLEVDAYPNPFRSSLSVKVINPDNAEVTMNLIDVTGRPVDIKIQSKSDDNIYSLETDKIVGGFYILRVTIGDFSKVIKVMKE